MDRDGRRGSSKPHPELDPGGLSNPQTAYTLEAFAVPPGTDLRRRFPMAAPSLWTSIGQPTAHTADLMSEGVRAAVSRCMMWPVAVNVSLPTSGPVRVSVMAKPSLK